VLFFSLVAGFSVATCLWVWKVIQKIYVGRLNASEVGEGGCYNSRSLEDGYGVSDMLFHMPPYVHF
jgi:hypothetical protein